MSEVVRAAQLDLSFARDRAGNTCLDRRLFRWPFTIARTFRLDRAPAGMLTVLLQSVSGAIQAGDDIRQRLHLAAGAQGHVTTQSATSVYRAPPGMRASDDIAITVEDGAMLEYMPEPRILFPDADLVQTVHLRVADLGVAVLTDGFVVHRPEGVERDFRRFVSETRIETLDDELVSLERTDLDGMAVRSGPRGRYRAFGTLTCVAPVALEDLRGLCSALNNRFAGIGPVYAAATILPGSRGLGLRIAAHDGRHLRQALQAGWILIRKELCGQEPARRAR